MKLLIDCLMFILSRSRLSSYSYSSLKTQEIIFGLKPPPQSLDNFSSCYTFALDLVNILLRDTVGEAEVYRFEHPVMAGPEHIGGLEVGVHNTLGRKYIITEGLDCSLVC